MTSQRWLLSVAMLLAAFSSSTLVADTTVYSVDQLRSALLAASPGDRIYVAPGTYNQRLWVQGVHGTPDNMIEVVALDPTNRPIFDVQQSSAVTFYDCSYLLVDGFVARGAGTASSGGNNFEFALSNHMVLLNTTSEDVTNAGNSDGFKFAHTTDFLVYNSQTVTWGDGGSGFDLYNSRRGLTMRTYFSHPLPPGNAANGTQPKGGAQNNGYYKNVFNDAGSRALQFGGSQSGNDWEDHDSVAMGNVIVDGEASLAYVSSTNSIFSYNTIVQPDKWIMRILKEGGAYPTADNTFSHNLVQYGNISSIQNIGSNTDPASFTYDSNYWYKTTNPAASIPSLPGGETNPAGGVPPMLDADYRPHNPAAIDYGAHAPEMEEQFAGYSDWFAWAWDKALVYEPNADAGGSYAVAPGHSVLLDGTGSYAGTGSYGDHTIVEWAWDLDRDNTSDDAFGASPSVSYDYLTGTGSGQLGLAPGWHTIQLRIMSLNEYNTLADWGTTELLIAVPGDCDLDGDVDGTDLAILGVGWAPAADDKTWAEGDFDGDGDIDGSDLAAIGLNWNPAGMVVPEPTGLVVLMMGAFAVMRRRGA